MSSLVKRQHFVPDSYLSQWSDGEGQIACHDLIEVRSFSCNPINALVKRYFYEEDSKAPDNRVENLLSVMEGNAAKTFSKLSDLPLNTSSDEKVRQNLIRAALDKADLQNIAQFAAYQYVRVPGAIEQKGFELSKSPIPLAEKHQALNPGRFVESGYDYVKDRFSSLKLILYVSPGRSFLTSDWPCFDLKDSENAPLLGEEIGQNPDVVCYLPLTPLVSVVFYHSRFSRNANFTPQLIVSSFTDSMVRNQNKLLIQQCERYVVASREEAFIFKIASERKKNKA